MLGILRNMKKIIMLMIISIKILNMKIQIIMKIMIIIKDLIIIIIIQENQIKLEEKIIIINMIHLCQNKKVN